MHEILSKATRAATGARLIRAADPPKLVPYDRLDERAKYNRAVFHLLQGRPGPSITARSRIAPAPTLSSINLPGLQLIYDKFRKGHALRLRRPSFGQDRLPRKMKCTFQFVTTPTADTPGTALLLHFDDKRYVVGQIGEGTQRAFVQRALSLMRVDEMLLTGPVSWKNAGGLLGMILTVADAQASAVDALEEMRKQKKQNLAKRGEPPNEKHATPAKKPTMRIRGGRNITHLVATARRFVFRKGMPLYIDELRDNCAAASPAPTWEDHKLQVWALPLAPEGPTTRPRKRSHEEISGEDVDANESTAHADAEDKQDQVRKAVVSQMFDSDWRLDALHPVKLAEVEMPAAIFVRNEHGHLSKYQGPLPGGKEPVPDLDVLVRKPWPAARIESLPPTAPSHTSISYIIKNHRQRGKFLVQKAKELKVAPASFFGKLASGESVTLADGRRITPDMVLAEGKDGGGVVVLDLPSSAYVAAAIQRAEWSSEDVMRGVEAFIWILGPGVAQDERLVQFMRTQTHYQHIVSAPDVCPDGPSMQSHLVNCIQNNEVASAHFPVPFHESWDVSGKATDVPYTIAQVGEEIQLEPRFLVSTKDAPQDVYADGVRRALDADVRGAIAAAQERVQQLAPDADDFPGADTEVVALGTGSALPSKHRNVSATLVRIPGVGSYLFDSGENTLGQLKRMYGPTLDEVLRDLRGIWISHLHADHHLGTNAVIRAWAAATQAAAATRDRRLVVASDGDLLSWLAEYAQVEDFGYGRVVARRLGGAGGLVAEFGAALAEEFGIERVRAVPVDHCRGALAVVMDFRGGVRVAYSGDCRPSSEFARAGRGATLLIHEATFDDALAGDARAKKHSTIAEAMAVGRSMQARRILLTHFSQRYPGATAEAAAATTTTAAAVEGADQDPPTVYALDLMRCRLRDFAKLQEFRGALALVP